jgi:23S rRNA (uracil1939-C5)-methyltransferase
MEVLRDSKTDRIIYISCDPATLARDTAVLLKGPWKINTLTAIDIFPNTNHIEIVCVLDKKVQKY